MMPRPKVGTRGLTALATLSLASAPVCAGLLSCGGVSSAAGPADGGVVETLSGWPTAPIDFGGNACGGAAPAGQTFTLINSGTVAAHIVSVTFGGVADYASSAAAGATVPAGGTLVVTLTAPAIPFPSAVPGSYSGSVTYTTDSPSDTPHQVNLTEQAAERSSPTIRRRRRTSGASATSPPEPTQTRLLR